MNVHPIALELQKLRESSKHAVANGASYNLDEFREYLHIEREVESKLKERIVLCSKSDKAQLLLVCGNVGDGKSHILSYLNKELSEEISQFKIHNDATESHNPNEKSNQTLLKLLSGFQDDKIEKCSDKIILAINLGTLNNFLDEFSEKFGKLVDYVSKNKILDSDIIEESDLKDDHFKHVNFTDYHMYSLTNEGPTSLIISSILERIVTEHEKNSIYAAYKSFKETDTSENCPICFNYEFLFDQNNRDTITDLLIQAIVKNKEIVSLRALLNFFYDLIVPIDLNWEDLDKYEHQIKKLKSEAFLNSIIPNYIFEHEELSRVFSNLQKLDPCMLRYADLDLELIGLINASERAKVFSEKFQISRLDKINEKIGSIKLSKSESKDALTKLYIRLNFFANRLEVQNLSDPYYRSYMKLLFNYNNHNKNAYRNIYTLVKDAARKWYGDPRTEDDKVVVNIGKKQTSYRVFKEFRVTPDLSIQDETRFEILKMFTQEFTLRYKVKDLKEPLKIHVDYGLYKILNQIVGGYLPNRRDNNNYLSFVSLINTLINQEKDKALDIDEVNIGKASDYRLKKDDFGTYQFIKL